MAGAIVLHSGGLDSTVVLAFALSHGHEHYLSLGFQYGGKHNVAEAQAAHKIVDWYAEHRKIEIERRVIQLPQELFTGGGRSALMGDIAMPHITYKEITESKGESPTVVPYRNGVMLSCAAALAETLGYDWLYVGTHGEDARNWAYPDCTPEFLGSQSAAILIGTYNRVRLSFPLDFMMKFEVVRLGVQLHAPLPITWSCYDPQIDVDQVYVHCGKCPTCLERAQAFKQANVSDSTRYASDPLAVA